MENILALRTFSIHIDSSGQNRCGSDINAPRNCMNTASVTRVLQIRSFGHKIHQFARLIVVLTSAYTYPRLCFEMNTVLNQRTPSTIFLLKETHFEVNSNCV